MKSYLKDFYDYKSKYIDGDTALIIPAEMTEEESNVIKRDAIVAFQSLDGAGLTRADFFLTKDGEVYINEVNTMPDLRRLVCSLWQHTGLPYPELIEELIRLAMERHEEKQKLNIQSNKRRRHYSQE